jgi:hypothetical protein
MKDKPKPPRLKPISLAHLTPEEAIMRAFQGKPVKITELKQPKKAK